MLSYYVRVSNQAAKLKMAVERTETDSHAHSCTCGRPGYQTKSREAQITTHTQSESDVIFCSAFHHSFTPLHNKQLFAAVQDLI